MTEPTNAPDEPSSAGARAALAGYDYQIDVSVLAALRILLVSKSASRITLEPANAEDIDVELGEDDPGHVEAGALLGTSRQLIIQVKLRNGGPWTSEAFDGLLNHGKRRAPAKRHLDAPEAHYLLVTNADVSGVARGLLVEGFEELPDKEKFPSSLGKTLRKAPEGRVAIYAGLTPRLLQFEIDHILSEILRVPKEHLGPCLASLRGHVRARMRGTTPGVWGYIDVMGAIRHFGGFLASAAELEAFVPPANFPDMIRQLESKRAVVIKGSSGTGKTLAARALCDHARKRDGALHVVTADPSGDPSSIRQLVQTGPKLFYLEDPWGQNSLRSGSEAWTEQLPGILRDARSGNQFVVTSRTDMLHSAKAIAGLAPWSVTLEADCYGNGRLAEIYDRRMDQLPSTLQSAAFSFKEEALSALEKPLELDLFFANILSGRQDNENERQWLKRLIGLAHRDAVEGVVDRYLTGVDTVGRSAAIWGVLAARGSIDRTQLFALMRRLRDAAPDVASGLDKQVDTMVAARHLRQPTTSISFAHPSVRAGFERHLKSDLFRFEPVFDALLTALASLPSPHSEWGIETCARLIDEGRRLVADAEDHGYSFNVPQEVQHKVDSWLADGLVDPNSDFPKVLQLACDVGSPSSNASEVARWLLTSVQRGGAVFDDSWQPPTYSDSWYERVSQDPRSRPIAARFVRDLLPMERGSYDASFPAALDRIAVGLDVAYTQAAISLIGMGHGSNIAAVVPGALRNLDMFREVFFAALDELSGTPASRAANAEVWRSIEDGERDSEYEEYYSTFHEDEGYTAGVLAGLYIDAIRAAGDWKTLAKHDRASEFGYYWAQSIIKGNPASSPSTPELASMFAAAKANAHESEGWEALARHWRAAFRPMLLQTLVDGNESERDSCAAISCAMSCDPSALTYALGKRVDPASRVSFLCDISSTRESASKLKRGVLRGFWLSLGPADREILRSLRRTSPGRTHLSTQTIEMLKQAAEVAPPRVLAVIVPLLLNAHAASPEPIRRWLSVVEDKCLAEAAAIAAVGSGDEEAIELALTHKRADARIVALKERTGRTGPPFSPELLGYRHDPGSKVRQTLLDALAANPHPNHLATLLHLVNDTWSDSNPMYNEPPSYPIARQSVSALASYAPLSDGVCQTLMETAQRTDDRLLARRCLEASARYGSAAARQQVRAKVDDRERSSLGVQALSALISLESVEAELLESFTEDWIRESEPGISVASTALVCRHAPIALAVALCERMANSGADVSLAVVGASYLHARDTKAAQRILSLLAEDHPARDLFADPSKRLPASVLDGLGDVRRLPSVRAWLRDRVVMN